MLRDEKLSPIFANDFHVHTSYSPCAKIKSEATPLEMVGKSEELGMKTIGFSDHFVQYPPYPTPKWKDCNVKMIESLQNDVVKIHTQVQILIGVEADVVAKDKLSIDKRFAKELDYVIVSASHFHLPGIEKPKSTNILDIAQHYVNRLKIALCFDFVSIIAHPFKTPYNPLGSPLDYLNKIPLGQLYDIAKISKQKKIAMEINAILGIDKDYLTAISDFIAVCKEVGVKFTYGSDAHNKTALVPSSGIEKAINALNLKPSDFLKTNELIQNHKSAFD